MPRYITYTDVVKEIPAIIEQEGWNYRHTGPVGANVHNGKGSCLIGRYLISLGVPVGYFTGILRTASIQELFRHSSLQKYVIIDHKALVALSILQRKQDSGITWGQTYIETLASEMSTFYNEMYSSISNECEVTL